MDEELGKRIRTERAQDKPREDRPTNREDGEIANSGDDVKFAVEFHPCQTIQGGQ